MGAVGGASLAHCATLPGVIDASGTGGAGADAVLGSAALLASAVTATIGALAGLLTLVIRWRRMRGAAAVPAPAEAPAPPAPLVHPAAPSGRPRILFVDDEPSFARVVRRVLTARGYDVDLAATPEEAIAATRRHGYALIIADYHLPGMTGLVLLDRLRTRTILYSGGFVGDGTDAASVGAEGRVDAVVAKGGTLAELEGVVDALVGSHGRLPPG